jgi:hypothetical protein
VSNIDDSKRATGTKLIRHSYAQILEKPLTKAECMKHGLSPGATWADAIALATIKAAADGSQQAAREIREATEGRAPTRAPETAPMEQITVEVIHIGGSHDRPPLSYDSVTRSGFKPIN